MKDIATLDNELDYMTHELARVKNDREYLLRFVARLLHPINLKSTLYFFWSSLAKK